MKDMPALDNQIDDLFDTYFYPVTTSEMWEQIRTNLIGLRLLEKDIPSAQ